MPPEDASDSAPPKTGHVCCCVCFACPRRAKTHRYWPKPRRLTAGRGPGQRQAEVPHYNWHHKRGQVTRRYDLPLIEDCCQAHLATYNGKGAGSSGDIGCFAFDAGKILSSGTGGAVITDDEYAARVLNFAGCRGAYGEGSQYGRRHKVFGHNYRYDSVRRRIGGRGTEVARAGIRRREGRNGLQDRDLRQTAFGGDHLPLQH